MDQSLLLWAVIAPPAMFLTGLAVGWVFGFTGRRHRNRAHTHDLGQQRAHTDTAT